ncbi:hypothetical protein niasHT_031533 [Heterodera trifolii]|uniref:Metalloprotease n=1 Tax=Heterodera trifolii TaxID=157864 RepID=A0ABD2HXQ8_9BILA
MSVDQRNNHLNMSSPDPVMKVPTPKLIKVLESAVEIQHRRTEALPDPAIEVPTQKLIKVLESTEEIQHRRTEALPDPAMEVPTQKLIKVLESTETFSTGEQKLVNVVAVLPCFVNFGKRGQRGQISVNVASHEVGHLAACEEHPHCFELVNITVIPRGPILGCIYHIIPDELTNEQLEAGMHLKGGGGGYEKIKYGRIRGMAHDEPKLHSFAYTLVKNKRLRQPRISLILPYNETQVTIADRNESDCGLRSVWNKTEKLVHKLVRVGSMNAAQVYREIGNLRLPRP